MSESNVLEELLKEVKVRPVRQDVLLLIDKPESYSELLWSPKTDPEVGLVLAVGPDTYDVQPGDRVWYGAGRPGISLAHIKEGLCFVHQDTLKGVIID